MPLMTPLFSLFFLTLSVGLSPDPATDPVTPEDHARALDAAYVHGWLVSEDISEQEAHIMPLFHEDVSVMVGTEGPSLNGKAELVEFWFPAEQAPYTILAFEHTIAAVDVAEDGSSVTVTGTYYLAMNMEGGYLNQEGDYTHTSSPGEDGVWRFEVLNWTSRPSEREIAGN